MTSESILDVCKRLREDIIRWCEYHLGECQDEHRRAVENLRHSQAKMIEAEAELNVAQQELELARAIVWPEENSTNG